MVREHLMGVEQNTRKTADILQTAKQAVISVIIGLVIYFIMKRMGLAP
jgi:hypothetical protein